MRKLLMFVLENFIKNLVVVVEKIVALSSIQVNSSKKINRFQFNYIEIPFDQ